MTIYEKLYDLRESYFVREVTRICARGTMLEMSMACFMVLPIVTDTV